MGQGVFHKTKGATVFERDVIPLLVLSHPPLGLTTSTVPSLNINAAARVVLGESCLLLLVEVSNTELLSPRPPSCLLSINHS